MRGTAEEIYVGRALDFESNSTPHIYDQDLPEQTSLTFLLSPHFPCRFVRPWMKEQRHLALQKVQERCPADPAGLAAVDSAADYLAGPVGLAAVDSCC